MVCVVTRWSPSYRIYSHNRKHVNQRTHKCLDEWDLSHLVSTHVWWRCSYGTTSNKVETMRSRTDMPNCKRAAEHEHRAAKVFLVEGTLWHNPCPQSGSDTSAVESEIFWKMFMHLWIYILNGKRSVLKEMQFCNTLYKYILNLCR